MFKSKKSVLLFVFSSFNAFALGGFTGGEETTNEEYFADSASRSPASVPGIYEDTNLSSINYTYKIEKRKKTGDIEYDQAKACLNSLNKGSFYDRAGTFDEYTLLPFGGNTVAIYDEKKGEYRKFTIPKGSKENYHFDDSTYFRVSGTKINFYEKSKDIKLSKVKFETFPKDEFDKIQESHVDQAVNSSLDTFNSMEEGFAKTELALSLFQCSKASEKLSKSTESSLKVALDNHFEKTKVKRRPASVPSSIPSLQRTGNTRE